MAAFDGRGGPLEQLATVRQRVEARLALLAAPSRPDVPIDSAPSRGYNPVQT